MKQIFNLLLSLCVALALLPPALAAEAAPSIRPTDLDQAVHREAVELMVDLGVIQGKDNGAFDPKGVVDRGTMAKLLYGIPMGGTDPALFSTVDTGLTDITDHWAENYIKYCSSVGIISGKGNNTFDPDGVVNVASAAKMLLVILGYDPIERGYSSDPLWEDNIMEDAKSAGLLAGISQYSFEPLTRDNAAQMLYNTLFAHTYTPKYDLHSADKVITGYTQNPTTLGLETMGLVRYTVKIGSVTMDAPPEVSYSSLFPKAESINDKNNILGQVRSGTTDFTLGPEFANSSAVFYVKADWTLTQRKDAIASLSLKSICSTALTRLPE